MSSLVLPGLMKCQACTLYGPHRLRVVPGYGPRPSRIMFVGQNPGADEIRTARPLTGESGQLLRRELTALGWDLDNFYSTNIVHCWPPAGRAPSKGESTTCYNAWVIQEVQAVDPDIIIPMGDLAYRQFMPERDNPSGITQVQGSVFKRVIAGRERYIIPCVNPAFVVRNEIAHLPALRRALTNAKQIHDHGVTEAERTTISFRKTPAEWHELKHIAKHADRYGFDLETTGLHPTSEIIGIGMCAEPGNGCYYPIFDPEEVYARLDELSESLGSDKQTKIVSNLKYETHILHSGGTNLNTNGRPPYNIEINNAHCTLVMAWLLGGTYPLGLKDAFHHQFGIEMIELSRWAKEGYEIKDWHGDKSFDFRLLQELRPADMARYAAQDPDASLRIFDPLWAQLEARGLLDLYLHLELPFMRAIIEMERNGIIFDPEGMGSVPSEIRQFIHESFTRMSTMTTFVSPNDLKKTGYNWNPNSWQQVQKVLYDDPTSPYQIPPVRVKGQLTKPTDKISLAEHYDNPLVRGILTHRALIKFQSYVNGLPTWVQPHTGRIHTEIKQTGTETGRVSSANPNLQNIPARRRDDIDIPLNPKTLRKAFVAAPGNYLFAPDLSQIEMRLAAHLSNDPTMVRMFIEDADLHANTATEIYGKTKNQVSESEWENMRYLAKAIGFGTLYGLTAEGLLKRTPSLNLTIEDAHRFIKSLYAAYPGLRAWQDEIKRFGREHGYVQTLLGRRRYLIDLTSKDKQLREEAYRAAINVPIQGSAADLFKLCVNETHKFLQSSGLQTRLVLQVHDEIVMEGPEEELDIIAQETTRIMTNIYPLRVPIKADFEYGKSWGDLTKYKAS